MAATGHDDKPLFIVGIGTSAGGLAALQQFFAHMPADSGMAFVVIQHLSPDFKSQMDDLLSRHTSMPIQKVTDTVAMRPNNIYLNISMTQMAVRDGNLLLTQVSKKQHVELPIDVFFTSLSKELGARAVGVILSGTGKDGTEGIGAIHRAGGLVAVQSPESAQFDAMPQSAVDTGVCDFILSADRIPAVLVQHAAEPESFGAETGEEPEAPVDEGEFQGIFDLLHREFNLDFAKYKIGTVGRRIRRRMGYRRTRSAPEYAGILASDPNERDDLYHDLLIGVTEFFRDDKAFQFLESTVIPELFASLPPDQDMRAWSAGCATGEEAYSLAILLAERAAELNFTGKICVFATDVHKRSLEAAAQGIFTGDRLAKVSPERLERFFVEVDKNLYKVKSELRKLLTFAHHDLTRDMPFSKLDLICCRNLLIYLQPETQKRVLSLFHFALNMNGVLFLGKSEGIGIFTSQFELLSAQNKMFRKVRDQKLAVELDPGRKGASLIIPRSGALPAPRPISLDRRVLNDYDKLLEKHIPPGVLVDENFHIVHFFGDVAHFLKTLKGRIETDILSMTEGHLHIALSTSLQKVKKTGKSAVTRNIRIATAEEEYLVDMTVDPIPFEMSSSLHYHVYFQRMQKEPEPPPEVAREKELEHFEPSLYYRQHLTDLELELQNTRADLSSTQDNLQATSEALNASNEELQAANEELQSANEELNSANEELHSTNEELYSVNTEFERSNTELKQLNVDLVNLLTSIDSGIIFLDKDMNIRKFNPAISALFKLLPQDVGRPIDHIAYQLADQSELLADIRSVLSDGVVLEKEVTTRDGEWLLSRIMPFRSDLGPREGVVITFTNITKGKEAELKVGRLNEELAQRIRTIEELRQKDQLMIQQSRMAAMGEMLGNIAHQWRQPLNVLGLQVQELRMAYKLGKFSEEVLLKGVAKAMEIIQHMSQTIDDFREFLALDKEKKPFRVDEVIKKSVSLIEGSLRERDIGIEIGCSGEPTIDGYANEYGQVILNILMNAKDAFAEQGKKDARITVRCWTEDGMAVVTITDNAGGIDQKIMEKIFDAYFTTKPLGKGTGVGLFMSNTIIEKSMGGRLSVRNVDGGAEFRIEV